MISKQKNFLDFSILSTIAMVFGLSLIALFSAGGENIELLIKHCIRGGVAFVVMLLVVRISPARLAYWSPHVYLLGLALLLIVLAVGFTGKGAQRWIDLGLFRFQPAEIMKLAVPMMVAWLLTRFTLPPHPLVLLVAVVLVLMPTGLVILQPDLGTAIFVALTGILVIFLAGVGWKWIVSVLIGLSVAAPILWVLVLRDYQRQRVLTLFDPWKDPLGAGYHTIQSIIAIGSGGMQGKGWLSGSQSQLEFIPERSTDFIFSVYTEEFGLLGGLVLLSLYLFLVFRGLMIAFYAHDTYSRLLAGSLSFTFFCYVFVNIGMVSGILPVVGVPLPLVSYGGTSMMTFMIAFGILMSIDRHKQFLSRR